MTTRKEFILANNGVMRFNNEGHLLVLGCNYHTVWQSHKQMRFVLESIESNRAILSTRTTGKKFTTHINSLIFITSNHNKNKAADYLGVSYKKINGARDNWIKENL